VITPALYYFTSSALSIDLNVNTGSDGFQTSETCSVSVAAGAAVKIANLLTTRAGRNLNIGYDAQLGYRKFIFTGYNTVFGYALVGGNKVYRYSDAKIRAYIRLDASDNGTNGELIFLPYEVDYDGTILLEDGEELVQYPDIALATDEEGQLITPYALANTDANNTSGLAFYYIHIGTINIPEAGTRSWLNVIQSGQLETAKGNNEDGTGVWAKMFHLSPSNIIEVLLPFDKLSFHNSGDTFIDRITNQHGDDASLVDADFGNFTEWIYQHTIATTRSVAAYIKAKIAELDNKYFRKDQSDTDPHLATFGDVHVEAGLSKGSGAVSSGSLEVDNDATIHGDTSIGGDATIEGETVVEDTLHVEKVAVYGENANGGDIVAQSSIYQAQVSGWAIDKNGNMEVSSLKVRNYLETEELRINRLQAQEGDTIFTDNDQIEEVEQVIDETDGSVSYILTFKDKWEGYFTAQRYGNILRGVINTLAEAYFAKQQGRQPIVDKDSPDYDDLPSDSGGNKFFTSWMKIIADRNTAQGRLGLNQVQVVLYADDQTLIPQDKNFPPCVGMVVAHWGCFDYSVPVLPDDTPEEKAQKEELIADIKKRQVFFYLSASEGRIMKLSQVDKPLLEEHNFGMTFGKTPDFIKQWPNYQSLIADHPSLADKDYLFAQGILCHDFIPVTPRTDKPLSTVVFCGDWEDGTNMSGKYFEPAYDQLVDLPCPMHGIYYHGAYNEYTGRYETHTVRHNSGTWMCLENQPVVSGGVSTYYPPKFGSPYWKLIDGNENYSIEFVSSNGQAFYRGNVDTVVTPNLFIGNVDITADISVSNWWWERSLEHPTAESEQRDETWNANHKRMRILHLTNEDMPMEWGLDNKVSFTCKVTINDGKTTRTVNNQVIV